MDGMTTPPITQAELRVLRALPRDGSPIGACPDGTGDTPEIHLRRMMVRGLCAMWPLRGWCITEAGIQAIDADTTQPQST